MQWRLFVIDAAIEAEKQRQRAEKNKGTVARAFGKAGTEGKHAFDERKALALNALHFDEKQELADRAGRRTALIDVIMRGNFIDFPY